MRTIEFLLQRRGTDAKVMNVKTLGLSSASFKLPAVQFCFPFAHDLSPLLTDFSFLVMAPLSSL
jgi:hypothetical protein